MKLQTIFVLLAVGFTWSETRSRLSAQGATQIEWEARTPSGLANSIQGVAWSPASARVAVGSTDRWMRTRNAVNGALIYSVLQPHRSGGADQTIYSSDGLYLAVHNSSGGLGYRVHRGNDGYFLGMLTVAVDAGGLVRFAPDTQLRSAVSPDGTLSHWKFSQFTVVVSVGSGYQRVTTTFNFSPSGTYQSAASRGSIRIQRRFDGSTVGVLAGGPANGFTPMAFSPDSTRLAVWAPNPNRTTLYRITDGAVLMKFAGAASDEGVGAVRFTPDGGRLVTTGYMPYVDEEGLWQQKGIIRFWRVADGALRTEYDEHTDLAVTSPIAWSPDGTRFVYGTYAGTTVVARTPAP